MGRSKPKPRYAIYFTPPPYSPLARFGASIIGYDCFEKADVNHCLLMGVGAQELAFATAAPRRYGFHATLVAPFHLKDASEEDLLNALDAFSVTHAPVSLGPVKVAALEDFIALTPVNVPDELSALEQACVEFFDPFRAPLCAADRERRLTAGLSRRQQDYLEQWGYPYVFEEFRFHMTLTGRLAPEDRARFKSALTVAFGPLSSNYVDLDALSLMRQQDRDTRFEVLERRVIRMR
jgi:putative phosphonate metabolism protein